MTAEWCELCAGYKYANCVGCGAHFLPPFEELCFDCRHKPTEEDS